MVVVVEVVVVVIIVVVVAAVVVVVVIVVVRAVWFIDGKLFWHVSFENHTRGMVFEKQKPSHLSAIKCLFSALEVIGISLLPLHLWIFVCGDRNL